MYYIYELDIFNQDSNTLNYNIYYYFYKLSKLFIQKSLNPKNLRTFEAQQISTGSYIKKSVGSV